MPAIESLEQNRNKIKRKVVQQKSHGSKLAYNTMTFLLYALGDKTSRERISRKTTARCEAP